MCPPLCVLQNFIYEEYDIDIESIPASDAKEISSNFWTNLVDLLDNAADIKYADESPYDDFKFEFTKIHLYEANVHKNMGKFEESKKAKRYSFSSPIFFLFKKSASPSPNFLS